MNSETGIYLKTADGWVIVKPDDVLHQGEPIAIFFRDANGSRRCYRASFVAPGEPLFPTECLHKQIPATGVAS